jgi:hypothetical protein
VFDAGDYYGLYAAALTDKYADLITDLEPFDNTFDTAFTGNALTQLNIFSTNNSMIYINT